MGKKNFKKRQTKPPGKLNIFVVDLDSRLHHVDSLEFALLVPNQFSALDLDLDRDLQFDSCRKLLESRMTLLLGLFK